ncbi:MAG TPA: hydantoinase/oxoprolinase family protein [Acidimicrobiales bacterium]|nr:hydantoinase/oxoprolinase family protein [Acidimicrobiales bacterium]
MTTIGVDVGGTFTDFVVLGDDGQLVTTKVPSTPEDPALAILEGLRLAASAHVTSPDLRFLHGSTITTNALIQRRGADCALLVTRGLKGIVQVQSQLKVGPRHSMKRNRPPALVDGLNVFEVGGRVDASGDELEPLDEKAVHALVPVLRERRLAAVAVCFLFSFANRSHEQRVKEILEAELPDCRIFCSSDVLPRIREWSRMSTTILDAYLEPPLVRYIESLVAGLGSLGATTRKTFLMESNGGVMPFSAATTGGRAIHTLLSGPAAAVQAARHVAGSAGSSNLVTMDLGGTSCDIAFVRDGSVLEVSGGEVCGYDLYVPMLDIATIGAGGGTIARVDLSGRLLVGPRSAGAMPGPAAYGQGGTEATITDADVVLGYLNPDFFLGGRLRLAPDLAAAAIEEHVARPLGLGVEEAGLAMVRINDAHMADAIRVCASKRGVSLAECDLLACGGAGPVHAAAVAEELGMRRVIVPQAPGVFAALGLLCTDVAQDYVQSDIVRLDRIDNESFASNFKALEMKALEEYRRQGFTAVEVRFEREIDARYAGQGFEIRVPVTDPGSFDSRERAAARFHDLHRAIYGHSAEDEAVEAVSYRVRAVVAMPQYHSSEIAGGHSAAAPTGERRLVFAGGEGTATVVGREGLSPGDELVGPAVVEQLDTTTVIPPRWSATVTRHGELVLTR